ncbi:PAS domain S-box-containing protein [Cyclonatronum proteinivorum]|uniref:histidine kinase n=1 Tax=Cyclonatronum proteinivorum TaxID=1457365 RepID=A0A345ULA5_9BACT|nr:PAS domain-containing protein [Cyclonatronum proteinivorum]AXJ01257.1 PAS domain S-box-containing protein [Cyclonatronum proteinivorum]
MLTRNILHKSPFGFLECRPIRDADNHVLDFEIISHNPKLAELLANIRVELSENRIGALFPGFNKQEREWAQIVGFVESGESCLEIETYFVSLDDWVRLFLFKNETEEDTYGVMVFDTAYEKNRLEEIESLFEASLDMLCIFDEKMQMVYLNNQWEQFTGYKRSELFYDPFRQLIHPEDKRDTLRQMTGLTKVNTLIIRNRILTKAGEVRHFEWKATHQNNRIYCAVRDVTSEVRKGEEIELLYKQLRSILDAMPNYIFAKDQRGRYLMANSQFANWYGCTPEEIVGKTDVDLGVEPKLSRKFEAYDIQVIKSGKREILPEMYEMNRETGEAGWFQTVKIPYQHPGLKETGILGISTNVTNLKQAEIGLKEKTIQYDLALKGTKDGVWDWELNSGRMFFSDRWMEQLGYQAGGLPSTIDTFVDHLHSEDRDQVVEYLQAFVSGEKSVFDFDFRMYHKDGSIRWINGRAAAIRDKSGRAVRIAGSNADITGRKKSERDLLFLKQILEETSHLVRVGSWQYVAPTDKLVWTDVCYLIHDLEPRQNTDFSLSDAGSFIHPDFRQFYQQAFDKLLHEGRPFDIEVKIITAKGRSIWVRMIARAEMQQGKIVRLIGSIQDIDERKRNRDELHKTRTQLSGILADMSDVVYSFDLMKRSLIFITPSVEHLYGIPQEEWMKDAAVWQKFTKTEDREHRKRIERAILNGEDVALEYCIRDASGTEKWIRNRTRVVYDEAGNKKRLDGLMIDITKQKRAELEVAEYSSMLKTLIDIVQIFISVERKQVEGAIGRALKSIAELVQADHIYIFEFDGTHTSMSMRYEWCKPGVSTTVELDKAYDISNVPEIADKITNKQSVDIFDVARMEEGSYKKLLQFDGVKSIFCTPMIDEGKVIGFAGFESIGSRRRFSANAKELLQVFAGILVNLKQRLLMEGVLDDARTKAEEASKAKSMFLANMSHEIRTPLNGVIGFSELLTSTELNAQQEQYLDYVLKSAKSLTSIINDILDFSKIEAGKLEIEYTETNIRQLIEETADIVSHQAAAKQLEIILDIDTHISEIILTDPIRLKQVLLNLMNNAVKFTDQGTVTMRLKEQSLSPERSRFYFEVRDTGIGIHPERQHVLFKAFSQADASDTRKYGGTGLGLAISSSIINKMGSKINLRSKPGKGSVFSFSLVSQVVPQLNGEGLTKLKQDQLAENKVRSLPPILMLEPVPSLLEQHRKMIKSLGASALGFDRIEAFMEACKENPMYPLLISLVPGDKYFQQTLGDFLKAEARDRKVIFLYNTLHESVLRSFFDTLKGLNYSSLYKPVKLKQMRDLLADIPKPLQVPKSVQNKAGASVPQTDKPGMNKQRADKLKVLIAEDVPMNLSLIKIVLAKLLGDIHILEAVNGELAVSLSAEHKPDFIIMDVHMPVMSGIDATKNIRMMGGYLAEVPIFALTAGVATDERQRCMESGMTAFLSKPLKSDLLKDVLVQYHFLPEP